MLRSSRTVVSLIHSLVMGTATTTAATVMVASMLVGCKDESQPDFWVEKLSDASWKARAVKRLEQFFEDAVTRNGNDIKAQGVQDLINKSVDPLTQTYVTDYDSLDSKTRVSLIKLLASWPTAMPRRTESILHRYYSIWRVRGEWFKIPYKELEQLVLVHSIDVWAQEILEPRIKVRIDQANNLLAER